MREILALLMVMTWTQSAAAIQFEIIGRNEEVLMRLETQADLTQSAGEVTLQYLSHQEQLTYIGDSHGISEIGGLGSDIVEENGVYKVYGWCYSINSVIPGTYAGETFLTAQTDTLRWFYAYALYQNGEWGEMCLPARN